MRRQLKLYLLAPGFLLGAASNLLADGGAFTAIDFPGAASTQAWGINPDGDIIGFYVSADKATHAKQAKQSLPSRAVRVERAPDDATMYLAKDVTSGLTVMSHPDTAHLRKMCDWIGWEVVEE